MQFMAGIGRGRLCLEDNKIDTDNDNLNSYNSN